MSPAEVAKLFVVISYYDTRHQASEGVVLAWHQSLYPQINFEFARDAVYAHYATNETMIAPAVINRRWLVEEKRRQEAQHAERISEQFAKARQEAVGPEVSQRYLEQIRRVLRGE